MINYVYSVLDVLVLQSDYTSLSTEANTNLIIILRIPLKISVTLEKVGLF